MAEGTPRSIQPFRDKKYVKDLIIYGDDGIYYYLSEEEWKANPTKPEDLHIEAVTAVQLGAVTAVLPERHDDPKTSEAAAELNSRGLCFLLNIAALKIPGEGLP